jgi:membrane-bound serine protease (ClpP class)
VLLVGAILLAIFVLDPPWSVVVIVVAAAVDVAETVFGIWYSKRRQVVVGAETLLGRSAEVVEPCLPEGQVRLGGEIWSARCATGAHTGERVRVTDRDGLVLVVEPDAG